MKISAGRAALAAAILFAGPVWAQSSGRVAPSAPAPAVMAPAAPILVPTPAPVQLGSPQPASAAPGDRLTGLWLGRGYQSYEAHASDWAIALTIRNDEYKIDYPSLGCGGHWTVENKSPREIVLTEQITYGQGKCIDKGTVKLGLVSSNAISFSYQALDRGVLVHATATLTRSRPEGARMGLASSGVDPAVEESVWKRVSARPDPEELRAFLRLFPTGRYADLGKLLLEELQPKKPDPISMIDYGRYHALVIGNNEYRHLPKLKTALNDAREMARLLAEQYGYQITALENATRYDILKAISNFRTRLGPSDNLLIYYAGHGILDQGANEGFWQAVDAETDNPANWIPNADLARELRGMKAKHVLIVADSCYSGSLMRGGIALGAPRQGGDDRQEWLRRLAEKRARTVLTSGGLEPVEDGGGDHSIFAKMLLRALSENRDVLDAQTLSLGLKRLVTVNSPQTPEYGDIRVAGHEGGDFIFVRKR